MIIGQVDQAVNITMAVQERAMGKVMEEDMIIPEITSIPEVMGIQDVTGIDHLPERNR